MLHEGLGAPRNHLEAVLWYCLAAETDYAAAQTIMGLMNREGLGVPERDGLQ
jgi:TPR repeat protein